jgi:dual specificity phosphatase 3
MMTTAPDATAHSEAAVNAQSLIPRVAQLTDQLWTGGALPYRPDVASRVIGVWRSVGIQAVVDTRAEWSDEDLVATVAPDIAYLNAGVVDGGQPMHDSWFETITAFASRHLSAGAGVLLHCHSGINRGPSAAFAVLLSIGWDPVEAIELIRTQRPIATVSYAENALDWWHRSSGIAPHDHAVIRDLFDQWRRADRSARFAEAQLRN